MFADTLVEDADTYRFLKDAAANVGGRLEIVKDGRNPFQVFKDDRFLGNSRLANCSKYLKQIPCRKFVTTYDPADVTLYVGIDWTETHRIPAIKAGWQPYTVEAPMCERPYFDKTQMLEWAKREELEPPAAYAMGMPHANCLAQGCVRGGQAYWANLLRTNREAFLYSEREESELADYLEADVSILKERTGGEAKPLTLKAFRERIEKQSSLFDSCDWGGCGCFVDETPIDLALGGDAHGTEEADEARQEGQVKA